MYICTLQYIHVCIHIYYMYVYYMYTLTGLGWVHARPVAGGLEGEGIEVRRDVAAAAYFLGLLLLLRWVVGSG